MLNWKGWVTHIENLDPSGSSYVVFINMKEPKSGPPRDTDVVLNGVLVEQIQELQRAQNVNALGEPLLVEFSGDISTVTLDALVSVINVHVKPQY